MDIIKVENLSVKYQNIEVLKDISFTIKKGDYIGIVGPNGAGKTTLVKTLMGLIEKSSGNLSILASKIGYLQQKVTINDAKFPANVFEIVRSGLTINKKILKFYGKTDNKKVIDILQSIGIIDLKNNLIGKLSGGQLQKVLLARALISNPDILILDEPTTALDPGSRENFYNLIKKINEEMNITILLISHDIGSIGTYAKKMIYIDQKMIFFGSFSDFCMSGDMSKYFGDVSQHFICHRHE